MRTRASSHTTVTLWLKAIGFALVLLMGSPLALIAQSGDATIHYQELVPLGAECFAVHGPKWRHVMSLLGSAESAQFQGMSARGTLHQRGLYTADGRRIANYPGRVVFRVTASFRTALIDMPPFLVTTREGENDYLLNLKFRLVVFHGLQQTLLHSSVEMIGVPAEMPYDERVYRITTDLSGISVADRVVLYVLDPSGARLTKFHLDLM